jgi:hypothetical protein
MSYASSFLEPYLTRAMPKASSTNYNWDSERALLHSRNPLGKSNHKILMGRF